MTCFECALVGAASFDAEHFSHEHFDVVVAVDGGFASLVEAGVKPAFALGDFDSLGYVPEAVECEVYPAMKDDSDTALALEWAREQGFSSAVVYGALGGRLDHTQATLAALAGAARNGMHVCAVGESYVVVVLASGMRLSVAAKDEGTFSVFSVGDQASGVSEVGPLYEVEGIELRNDVTLGLSNEFVGKPVSVFVESGTLLVFLPSMPLADIEFA